MTKKTRDEQEQEWKLRWEEEQATIGRSRKLKPADVKRIEKELKSQPNDLAARLTLIDYYFLLASKSKRFAENRLAHIAWVIENHTNHWILSEPWSHPQNLSESEILKKVWQKQIRKHPNDPIVFEYAAVGMWYENFALCEKWLLRSEQLAPKRSAPYRHLCFHYWLKLVFETNERKRKRYARGVVKQGEVQMKLDDMDAYQKWERLSWVAYCALMIGDIRKARKYTALYSKQCERFSNFSQRGPAFKILMDALFAMHAGKVDLAAKRLMFVEILGDGTFALMRWLIRKGKAEDVVRYLKLSSTQDLIGRHDALRWVKLIERGEVPQFNDQRVTYQ